MIYLIHLTELTHFLNSTFNSHRPLLFVDLQSENPKVFLLPPISPISPSPASTIFRAFSFVNHFYVSSDGNENWGKPVSNAACIDSEVVFDDILSRESHWPLAVARWQMYGRNRCHLSESELTFSFYYWLHWSQWLHGQHWHHCADLEWVILIPFQPMYVHVHFIQSFIWFFSLIARRFD